MTIGTGTLILLFLPFLLSLAGHGFTAKFLGLTTSLLALLLSVEPGGAALPWSIGMTIALVSIWERLRQHYVV